MKIDYINKVVREEAVIGAAYDPTYIIDNVRGYNQMVVNVELTIGELDNAQLRIEFSPDRVTWFRETAASVDGLISTDEPIVHRFERTANFAIPVPITTNYVRLAVAGNGDVTDSLMAINVDLGVN